ncbi:hypothetical protein O6H91_10G029100 [Diphasiastrum complanatum]|uniref:Uncharacterized protein n=1 Tax=Diphasiastrum complanatum TaxID=34168 RepID=A0ACC2CFD7_DIPCM|nr:hypothetical protein O6H91_Y306500 [Diphasiastrum complanatum]KAJ7540748.1 hypothetical protein O6H91_10G029100 [Diphasiastrum complanatum]
MPADDTRGLMSDKYDGMASKAAAHSTLNPKAPYCVSTNRRLLCTVVERVRDCWIRRKGQYVDGEELTAADVDHLEAMVDFINQEEPDVTVDESLEDFISCSGRTTACLLIDHHYILYLQRAIHLSLWLICIGQRSIGMHTDRETASRGLRMGRRRRGGNDGARNKGIR